VKFMPRLAEPLELIFSPIPVFFPQLLS